MHQFGFQNCLVVENRGVFAFLMIKPGKLTQIRDF
jgi:hypothetical protein